jgi:hypothetical protein
MQATLVRAIATAGNSNGHVIRLSNNDVVIAVARKHLLAAGLAPTAPKSSTRRTDIEVTEIGNSLQLREVLGLTSASETQTQPGKPLIH